MRIGKVVIDTDSMTTRELSDIITELRTIRARKEYCEDLQQRMSLLLNEAEKNKFAFVDDETGRIWDNKAFIVADMA